MRMDYRFFRNSFRDSTYLALGVSLVAGMCGLPGRLEEMNHFRKDGFRVSEYLFSAFLRDTNLNLIFFIAIWVGLWALLKVHTLWKRRANGALLALAFVLPTLLIAVASFLGSEFRVERGIYPSWFDINNSQGGSGVGMAYARLAVGQTILPGWGALLISAALFTRWLSKRQTRISQWTTLMLSTGLLVFVSNQARLAWFASSPYLKSLLNNRVTESPFGAFVRRDKIRSNDSGFFGVRSLLQTLDSTDPKQVSRGLSELGIDPSASVHFRNCERKKNPLAQSLDKTLNNAKGIQSTSREFGKSLEDALVDLSTALFSGVDRPINLYQVLVESFLSADFASLGSPLPQEAIPHWNALIEKARQPGSSTIIAGNLRQAGVRTSQAISASFCGLGTLPHLLSMGRDLLEIQLRCLPELLKDRGCLTEMHHGYRPEFDQRTQFFAARGMDFWHIRRIPGAQDNLSAFWDGDIGLSDRRLMNFTLSRINTFPAERSTYTGILTLSSHRPFKVPDDFLPEDRKAAEQVLSSLDPAVAQRPLTSNRVMILRYVDAALNLLMEGVAKASRTSKSISIAIAYGDHSHSEADLFGERDHRSPEEQLSILSRIPFFIHIFPESLKNHPHKREVQNAIQKLNQVLKEHPVSQNDIPRMILTLLSKSKPMLSLAKEKRWHTLGGQILSPYSKPPIDYEKGVVWGVDGQSEAFVIDESGAPLLTETQGSLDSPDAAKKAGLFSPVTRALSEMVKHNAEYCPTQPVAVE